MHRCFAEHCVPILVASLAIGGGVAAGPAFAQQDIKPKKPTRPLDELARTMEPSRRIVYKRVTGEKLELHLFAPDEHRSQDRRAAFVIFHGGGWTGGSPRRSYPFAKHFAQRGMVGISVGYRLLRRDSPTTVFDCVRDARSAVRFVRRRAKQWGIHPDKIVVCGNSAGAHLAAGTALFGEVNDPADPPNISPTPNALVLFYPVIDTSPQGYGQTKIGSKWREISPLHQVQRGMPPTLILHGTADTVTPFAGAQSFCERSQALGNTCRLIAHDGGQHGYLIFDIQRYQEAIQQVESFLTEQGFIQ